MNPWPSVFAQIRYITKQLMLLTSTLTMIALHRRAYRWGMLGPFQKYTELNFDDEFHRVKNVWGKAFLGRIIWPYKKLRSKKYSYPGF